MQTAAKISVMKRLKRIEGQVRGLARMVEEAVIALTS
jgi:DNA-binding FrmR family transcriptional regulator